MSQPEPRSDIPTLLSDTIPTLFRHSDTVRQSDIPTVRHSSDSCPTLFCSGRPFASVILSYSASDIPTFRHQPSVIPSVRHSDTTPSVIPSVRHSDTTPSDSPTASSFLCLLSCYYHWRSRIDFAYQLDTSQEKEIHCEMIWQSDGGFERS